MKLKLLGGSEGNRGNQSRVEVTYKTNIYNSKVTLVTLVTSILPRACERTKKYRIKFSLQKSLSLCKLEVTEVTEVTRLLQLSIFQLPLLFKSYLWLPLLQFWRLHYE